MDTEKCGVTQNPITSDRSSHNDSTVNGRNYNRRYSDQACRINISHNAFGKTEFGCTNSSFRNGNLKGNDDESSRRKRVEASLENNEDGNSPSNAKRTMVKSGTFSVPRYPRSSSMPRTTSSKFERNIWHGRKLKMHENAVEFQFNKNRNESSYSNKIYERDHRNDGYARLNDRYDNRNQYRSNKNGYGNYLDNSIKHTRKQSTIGYEYLKALSEKEPHEMICEILRSKANIDVVLNRKKLEVDWIMLIMETVRKLCDSDFKDNRIQILQYFCESPLLDHVSHYLGEVGTEKSGKIIEKLNFFVSDLISFYSAVICTIPTVAVDKNFSQFLIKTEMSVYIMKTYLHIDIDEKNLENLVSLKKILENETNICEKKLGKPHRRTLELNDISPSDDFRELSLYPTKEDLNRYDFGFIRPNKIRGAYEDVNHYLDVQFRLIREDFIGPLRHGLRNYKDAIAFQSKPKYKYESVRFYRDVRIENISFTKGNQVGYVVNFDLNGRFKNVNWEYSKWFMFGSLLLFTCDNFESFFFATVSHRDPKNLINGRILVTLIGNEPLKQEMLKQPFLMVESEVYFEPYYLIMKALKEYNENNFPMRQFIVDGNTAVELPRYIRKLENFHIYDYSVNMALNYDWPHHSEIGFDEHQFNAFKTALTSNFTVIQGPPGTGKTYLGLKIIEVLWNNIEFNSNSFKTPILLVCYTNHALDQFLEGILKFTKKIVRVGSQSKSEILKPFNLRSNENLTELRRKARELVPTLSHCRDEMSTILHQIEKTNEEKKIIESPKGILSYNILIKQMKPAFKKTIFDERTLLEWLLPLDCNDPSIPKNSSKMKVAKNFNINSIESVKVNNRFLYEEYDEVMDEDVLVDEDDVFKGRGIDPVDLSVTYCISLESLIKSLDATHSRLLDLEKNQPRFHDYSEYDNRKYQLIERARIAEFLYEMLNYRLQNAKLDSFINFKPNYFNLWEIPICQRWRIYWSWVSQLKENFTKELNDLEVRYRLLSEQYSELKQLEDFHVVKNSFVVGMTTTGAARLQLLLKTLKPAIVIVEEAAEVLEAHIVVSLSKNCEHVILIGDHKQLKPSAAVYELSKKYNINVSLFERMINNNMHCPQLQIQHRMRPEISSLIQPSIYPNLKNHESVLEYPSIEGITKNLFFVDHNVYEEQVDNSSSRKNKFEADFVIELCRYILLQGYSAHQITILTTYTGQMFHLKEMKRKYAITETVKVIVVDKYQGEENDIILLSLVRSNEERKIGFLSIENRVCVALSRAKIGLYIIGNMDILSDSNLWKNIKEELVVQEAIGPKLTLHCDKHDVFTQVSCKKDFVNVAEGGCHNVCNEVMDCGHKCQLLCHKIDMEHLEKKCHEKCLKKCNENHSCKKYCYEDCGHCNVPVERTLPCGHVVSLPCFVNFEQHPCNVEITVVLQPCLHEVVKKCHQSIEKVECFFPCEDRLECGHRCRRKCHKNSDPDHLTYKCQRRCDKINQGCSKEHECKKLCFEDCGKCEELVVFTLHCDHLITLPCSTNIDEINCYERCNRKCSECNVVCGKRCNEDCKPCKNMVTKCVPECGHKIKLECSIVPRRELCEKRCQRVAPCGHKCKSLCKIQCGTEECKEIVKSTCVEALCGHGFANVPCCKKDEAIDATEWLSYCTEPCLKILKCGDLCAGTCGSCWQGRLHKTCANECRNILVCGHRCPLPCRKTCLPCAKKCQYFCKHYKCPKNCGLPCVPCKKKCEWKCVHMKCSKKCGDLCNRDPCYEPCEKKLKCNHDCIGFCGEPCPDKCRICDKDDVTAIIFGNEDEENARFVLLVDCGHFLESKAMDRYIFLPARNGEIVMKVCPVCKTPISTTLRYMNEVKKFYRDIQNVKKKCNNQKEMKEICTHLERKLIRLDMKNFKLFGKELYLIYEAASTFQRQLRMQGSKQSYLSNETLRAMRFFTDMFSSIICRLNGLKKCAKSDELCILNRLKFILKRTNPKGLLINVQQVDDLSRELNRYHRMVDYCVYIKKQEYLSNENSPDVIAINTDIVSILYGLKCFDDKQDIQIGELFEKLQKAINCVQPLSQKERRMIHAAMSKNFDVGINSQSRWFVCAKGHYYRMAECDVVMGERRCPECTVT